MFSHCLKVIGSLFHIVGAATEKARSPNVLHVLMRAHQGKSLTQGFVCTLYIPHLSRHCQEK